MRLARMSSPEDPLFPAAWALYLDSFPLHEQRTPESQREALRCDDYHFGLLMDGELFAGLLLYWETVDFLYVEHFSILPSLRGKGCGAAALTLLDGRGKPVILEIDPPVDEISIRRKGFYTRAGYVDNSFPHIHPPYHAGFGGHSLVVLSSPTGLKKEEYAAFRLYLQVRVMAR